MWDSYLHFTSLEAVKNINMLLTLNNLVQGVILPWICKCAFLLTRVLPLFFHTSRFFFLKWVDFLVWLTIPNTERSLRDTIGFLAMCQYSIATQVGGTRRGLKEPLQFPWLLSLKAVWGFLWVESLEIFKIFLDCALPNVFQTCLDY